MITNKQDRNPDRTERDRRRLVTLQNFGMLLLYSTRMLFAAEKFPTRNVLPSKPVRQSKSLRFPSLEIGTPARVQSYGDSTRQ
jgi:hypothetical protein